MLGNIWHHTYKHTGNAYVYFKYLLHTQEELPFFFFFSVTRGEVQSIAGSRHRTAVPLFLWFPWSCHPPWFGFIVRLLARWLQELPGFTSRSNNFHRKKNKRTTPPCIYFLGRGNLSQQPPSALFTFHWPWLDHIPIDFLPLIDFQSNKQLTSLVISI